jgi:L-threonylcarbamoyladenylate synthase
MLFLMGLKVRLLGVRGSLPSPLVPGEIENRIRSRLSEFVELTRANPALTLEEFMASLPPEKLGGFGIAAPSANRFGAVSPTSANAVLEELGSFLAPNDLILDGDKSSIGVESSIIDCTRDYPTVLRPGAVTSEMIEKVTGLKIPLDFQKSEIRTSGLLESHYSPNARVMISKTAEPGDGFLAFANILTPPGAIRLGSPKNVEEYARIFYEALRRGDQKGLKKINVVQPEGDGLAVAIRDRLSKSTAGKDLTDRG